MTESDRTARSAHLSLVGDLANLRSRMANGLCDISEWRTGIRRGGAGAQRAPVGVFVHIYYETAIRHVAEVVKPMVGARIYVSTTSDKKKWLIQTAFRELNIDADVRVLPNVGFDVGPLLFGFRDEIRSHEICLHLHGKESRHASDREFGEAWRKHLFTELAGDSERIELCIDAFNNDPELGMLIPRYWRGIEKWIGLGNNWENFRSVIDSLGISVDRRAKIDYPAGSMFWFRSAAIEPLLRLNLNASDFEESSSGASDSTLAHAIERAFLFCAAKAGYRWAFLPEASEPEQYVGATSDPAAERRGNDFGELPPLASLFDPAWYMHQYPDVANSGMDALDHYIRFGASEGRSPHPLFQADWYIKQNPEVARSGLTPFEHFLLVGAGQGLKPHPLFDTNFYRQQIPDPAPDMNPLLHYLSTGASQGLLPSREFNVIEYVRSHADAFADPLSHFTTHGGLPPLTGRRRIQVFRRGALGDVLLMTPVLREVRRKYASAEIVVSTLHPEVLRGNPNIDFVVGAAAPLYGCDTTFNLDGAYEMHPHMHIVDAYADVMGVQLEDKRPEIYLDDADRNTANDMLRSSGIHDGQAIAVLQPAAGWKIKNWTDGRFETIASALLERGIQPVVLGNAAGDDYTLGTDLRGKTEVRVAAAIIERSAFMITVDSGLMHVAFALRRPVVGLFGCTLPELIVPPEDLGSALYADIACRGCHHRQPAPATNAPACIWGAARCMDGIAVDAVRARIAEIMAPPTDSAALGRRRKPKARKHSLDR